ncbi:MAG: hypothetical protein QG657_5765 [Acidobacteriota bacterium]|nr:hypothetical protein [Acidobacteriota bacterium]
MNIRDEIRKGHENLSKTSLKFLEFVEKNPWCLKHSLYEELKWPWVPWKIKFQPWPVYINQHVKKEVADAGISVFNLIKNIPGKIFNFDAREMSGYYEIPAKLMVNILAGTSGEHLNYLFGRGDFVYSPPQGFKCLEYNIAGNLGGWELPFWHSMYMKNIVTAKFFEENHLENINEDLVTVALRSHVNNLIKKFPHNTNEMTIAMVMAEHQDGILNSPVEKYSVSMYRQILQSMNLHGELIVCDYGHLKVQGDYLYYKGKRVLCIHENYGGIVPDEMLEIFYKGNLVINAGPLTFLMTNKLNIALLSEHEESDLFTPGERESITKYIPWTRKTTPCQTRYRGETVSLETFVLANKDKLVLKPALNLGGKQILIGLHTSQPEWEQEINKAFCKKAWLVQEYIEPSAYLFQEGEEGYGEHNIVWGMFVFGGTYAGSFVRTLSTESNKGIINVNQGADITVVFEVRE